MAVSSTDLKHYPSEDHPSDDTSTVGGAIDTASGELGSALSAIFHVRTANEDESDDTKYQYKKTFVKNTNASTDLESAKIYMENALDDLESNELIAAVSASASDDDTMKIKIVGEDASGNVQTEEVTLNGTTEVESSSVFSKIFWIELQLVADGTLTTANGDITISADGTTLGIIPQGSNCALSIVEIGLVATLDDSGDTTDATTAPGGISFSKPRTFADGLEVANSGTLSSGSGQGIWWKQTVEGGLEPGAEITAIVVLKGGTT